MKIIVTGGAGFIGSMFAAKAVERGDEVIVLDALTYAGHPENLESIKNKSQLVVGDICDAALAYELLCGQGSDAIINFAAESHVDNSISGPGIFIKTNVEGTYSLLEAARKYWNGLTGTKKNNFRFIQISTDEVYGSLGEAGKFNEETPMRPNSPYSASKAAGDHLARAWHETYGLPTIITNCSNNYGPRQFPEKLIPKSILDAISGRKIGIYGDGKNIRDWIHVEDHAEGVQLALVKGKPGETYCFGGNAERNNSETANKICEILDELRPLANGKSYKSQITFITDRPGHDRRYAIDDAKAVRELSFKRKYDFAGGLEATVKWYLENQAWIDSVTDKSSLRANAMSEAIQTPVRWIASPKGSQ